MCHAQQCEATKRKQAYVNDSRNTKSICIVLIFSIKVNLSQLLILIQRLRNLILEFLKVAYLDRSYLSSIISFYNFKWVSYANDTELFFRGVKPDGSLSLANDTQVLKNKYVEN